MLCGLTFFVQASVIYPFSADDGVMLKEISTITYKKDSEESNQEETKVLVARVKRQDI